MNRKNFIGTTLYGLVGITVPQIRMTDKSFEPIRFGIVTDIHYSIAPDNHNLNRYYRQSLDKLEEFVEVMNQTKVDFIVEIGDLKDQGTPPKEAETLLFLRDIEAVLRKFEGPVYHVLGNHDHDSISKTQFLKGIRNTGFEETRNYYSFTRKGIHFIVLDANYEADGKEYDHGKFDWTKAYLPPEQLVWLKSELHLHSEPILVFVHHQLDSPRVEDLRHCPVNSNEVRAILEDSGKVAAVFQGHYHKGSINYINGICYYTLKALVEGSGPENNNYAIVKIETDGMIKIKGFRKTVSQELLKIKSH